MVHREFKLNLKWSKRRATNMRTGLRVTLAILALILGLAYQGSQQVVVVHATTRRSHE